MKTTEVRGRPALDVPFCHREEFTASAIGSVLPTIIENSVLILGIGNPLWADDGFGVRTVQALVRQCRLPPQVTVIDGGTQGLALLSYLQATQRLLVFDALDYGLPAGTVKVLKDGQVPKFLCTKKLSFHQTGFPEVLALAELTGCTPAELVLIGVQPVDIANYGGDLHPQVSAQIPVALEIALDCLRNWGIRPESDSGGAMPALPRQYGYP
jgi:hydrogenase maturation protease